MGEKIKKYHITDDGDVYRVNDDGSFTSMGNAEKMSESNTKDSSNSDNNHTLSEEKPTKPNSHKKLWVYGITILIIIVGGIFYFTKTSNNIDIPSDSDSEINTDTMAKVEPTVENIKSVAPKSSQETKSQSKKDLTPRDTHQYITETNKENTGVQEITPVVEPIHRIETQNTNSIDSNKVYYAVEVQAEYPGGDKARLQWLRDHIEWPNDVNGKQLHGDVELEFIIERDGSVSNVKVTNSDNPELNSAAITLISSMPRWSPAMVRNQPVRSPMGITLFF